ncbi:hypothetical protein DPMN_183051 [Dreissena polymorpha]|uniref:Uncharacterized protein n=1 Tax=Dreissena polymorpha TaxID=45954 RepID=A0A9D4DHI1_DREPO|nr:hypothetical protein DPMN_183051 [Dreissena polymorpha]
MIRHGKYEDQRLTCSQVLKVLTSDLCFVNTLRGMVHWQGQQEGWNNARTSFNGVYLYPLM